MSTQSKVALRKERFPEQYCTYPRCLWHTGGGRCPRHILVATATIHQHVRDGGENWHSGMRNGTEGDTH